MAEGRSRAQWQHTSALLAMLVNANPFRGKGTKAARPSQFDPFAPKPAPEKPIMLPLRILAPLLVNAMNGNRGALVAAAAAPAVPAELSHLLGQQNA